MREPLTIDVALADESATNRLGASLADALPADAAGWLVGLRGELGAGKSTLARAMLRAMGHRGAVPSPTYTLVEPYELKRGMIYHVDLYRIVSVDEIEFLGLTDLRDGLLLIEWPERAPELLEAADLIVSLAYRGAGRTATLAATSERAESVVSALSVPGSIK